MMIRGCLRRAFALVLLLAIAGAAWYFRSELRGMWRSARGEPTPTEATAELADAAQRKLDDLSEGTRSSVSFSAVELQSLLIYRYRGILPAFLDSPTVELRDDRLRLRARVPLDKLPHIDGFAEVASFLPDTTELTVTGTLLPLDSGRIAFGIDEVGAARIPLPRRLVPPALDRIGRRDEPNLPRDAIAVRLPPGVSAAYLRRDSLVLMARPPARQN